MATINRDYAAEDRLDTAMATVVAFAFGLAVGFVTTTAFWVLSGG